MILYLENKTIWNFLSWLIDFKNYVDEKYDLGVVGVCTVDGTNGDIGTTFINLFKYSNILYMWEIVGLLFASSIVRSYKSDNIFGQFDKFAGRTP